MDSLSLKIQELEIELSGLQKKLEESREKCKKLDLEISQVKFMEGKAKCIFNDEKRIMEESRADFKKVHEAYQKLSPLSMTTQCLQYAISNRREELLEEKEKLESQLGHIKLKRSIEKEKLEEIRTQAMIQKNKKRALIWKLQNNCKKSEVARRQAEAKLMEVKNKKKDL